MNVPSKGKFKCTKCGHVFLCAPLPADPLSGWYITCPKGCKNLIKYETGEPGPYRTPHTLFIWLNKKEFGVH